jgi:N-acetylglutamate synthase-like GNAT family acetyltransferase
MDPRTNPEIVYEKSSGEAEGNRHIFKSFDEKGNVLATAKLEYISSPERMFMVRWIGLEDGVSKGGGVGAELLQRVNFFYKRKSFQGYYLPSNQLLSFIEKMAGASLKIQTCSSLGI